MTATVARVRTNCSCTIRPKRMHKPMCWIWTTGAAAVTATNPSRQHARGFLPSFHANSFSQYTDCCLSAHKNSGEAIIPAAKLHAQAAAPKATRAPPMLHHSSKTLPPTVRHTAGRSMAAHNSTCAETVNNWRHRQRRGTEVHARIEMHYPAI
jgi:hypothetical protein